MDHSKNGKQFISRWLVTVDKQIKLLILWHVPLGFLFTPKKDKENDYIIHRGLVYQGTYSALLAYQHMP